MILLAVLAPSAVLASAMPRPWAWAVATVAVLRGAWLVRREARRPRRDLVLGADGGFALDGRPLDEAALCWRGPLAFLRWRDPHGRMRHLVFWPDTLPAARRRELRLAHAAVAASRGAGSMAP